MFGDATNANGGSGARNPLHDSKAFAAAVVECFSNPAVLAEAKRTFKEELGGVEYRSMLPADQKPPVALNRAIMEKFRPEMKKHYLKERPEFR